MVASEGWRITPSSSIGGSYLIAASAAKYILENGNKKRNLYWAGAGAGLSIPGLPASGGVSTAKHWAKGGAIYFSELAPHKTNKYISADSVFSGQGIILEVGANSAVANILGIGPLLIQKAKELGIQEYENHICGQILLFNTTFSIINLPSLTAELLTILADFGIQGKYHSIYTQAIGFVASTSSAFDSAGVTAYQGSWFLSWW